MPKQFFRKNDLAARYGVTPRAIVQLKLNPQLPCETRERKFLDDMTQLWGEPTEKQAKWLAAIHNRFIRNGARHA